MTPAATRGRRAPLLYLAGPPLLFQLRLDRVRLVLRHARLHGLRRAINEVLRFLQAEPRDLTDDLDDLNLLRAGVLEHDRELGLLLDRRSRTRAAGGRGSAAHRGSGDRDVELALE